MADYDVVIVGSGVGGYVAAIRASQLGMKSALVEQAELGGTCLNWGCIPSKALLRNAEVVGILEHADEFGIAFDNLRLDFGKAIDRSRQIVKRLTDGVSFLLKKNDVRVYEGSGALTDANTVEVRGAGETLTAENIVIATGAKFRQLPNLPIDGKVVITSREALALRSAPRKAVIVGGGATGAEFAYLWAKYGSDVTLVELLPRLAPSEDEDVSSQLERSFRRQGITSLTGSSVDGVAVTGDTAMVTVTNQRGTSQIECDTILVAVGAQGNIDGIGLDAAGVETAGGYIPIGEMMETNVENIYAIGDVTGKMLLAHVASAQGVTAVEHMAGLDPQPLDYDFMPRAIYCRPQIGSFGLTEAQATERGYRVKSGRFPFAASGKALALGESEGFVKVVIDEEIGDILGAHMIGAEVTEFLGELGMARLLESTSKELGWLVHPHPTLSEAIKEAALAADGEAIHI